MKAFKNSFHSTPEYRRNWVSVPNNIDSTGQRVIGAGVNSVPCHLQGMQPFSLLYFQQLQHGL
jgi:hypothetical protein